MKKSQVKLLVNEMQTYMNLSTTATDVVVKVDSSKSKEMADMLVMAMVARFIPKKQEESDEHPFLEYNEATHVLRRVAGAAGCRCGSCGCTRRVDTGFCV